MKKLVSIFAALAMVGALAAQKRKAPAKKAAAPAPVAAPAAPAAVTAPAPVVAAPAASGKGLGLSIEARGSWIQSHGTSDAKLDGTVSATAATYELSNSNGFGGGLSVGYSIAQNLGLVASFDYRAISTREWTGNVGGKAATTASTKQETNTMVLGLGVRPSVNAFGGEFYAGMGFAYVLPYENKTTITSTNFQPAGGFAGDMDRTITAQWNAGLGVYGELGYNYPVTDMIFVGVGVRGLVATANNDGKKEITDTTKATGNLNLVGITVGQTTKEYAASYDPSATLPAGTTKAGYQSQGITDMTVSITVGARF